MVMVVSTPSGPLKTFRPSSFRFCTRPCRLLGWTTTSMAAHASSSPQIFLRRRDLHYHWSPNNPSSKSTNLSSSKRFQKSSSYFTRQHSTEVNTGIVKRVSCYQAVNWEPVVSETQSSPTTSMARTLSSDLSSFGSEDRRNYINLSYPWVQERERLKQSKLEECNKWRHFVLEEVRGAQNGSVGSEASETGSDYVTKYSPDSSLCSPNVMHIEGDGQSQPDYTLRVQTSYSSEPILINGGSIGMDSGKMGSTLKRSTTPKIQFNEPNARSLETSDHFSPYKVGTKPSYSELHNENHKNLARIYSEVLVINDISSARKIVGLLTTNYRNLVHACDTEVAKIDVKHETPVDHGEIICFSIYSGSQADFGNGKSCIWVDVLDGGGKELLMEFAPFFEDSSIRKVWHNYSFDSHVIENYGIKISGFHADTMHMARLWDSSRRTEGGYSLEALTRDSKVMNGAPTSDSNVKPELQSSVKRELIGKISMKSIFGKRKLRRDGSEGKIVTIAPVEELQREDRILWICYSAVDSMSTLQLYESLQSKLEQMDWVVSNKSVGTMYNFYERYWRPFGELLVKMETEGMLVDLAHLAEIQKVAVHEQQIAANRFRNWAARYCPDAMYMNVGSDIQLRQLFFGGSVNSKDPNEILPLTRDFKVPNIEGLIDEGRKVPSKFRNITLSSLHNHGIKMETEMYTATGWPSISGDALKTLAGKVSSEYDWIDDAHGFESDRDNPIICDDSDVFNDEKGEKDIDVSSYGTAYKAFGANKEGREACHAIAALCEVCSIDSLISNFILPLQSNNISGQNGRIHCSLNINTETGRLSARRPNLQNQPALEKDRYKIRQAFIAAPGNSLIVADYGQLELRILAHLADCKSMKEAFEAGGDFHSRTAMNMYSHIRDAVEKQEVLLEWHPQPGEAKPPVPLLKDAFASERRKAKMLNFSIAYGKTPVGLSRDWKVSVKEARATVNLWYKNRKEVLEWQKDRKKEANEVGCVKTLLGRTRTFPSITNASYAHKGHIERAAINTPVQGSAADVAMCAMLEISTNDRLKELGWRLLLQVHDEVILEGPSESAELAKGIVVECMAKPFGGKNILSVDLAVDAKCAQNWYAAK